MNFYECVKRLCKQKGTTIEAVLNEALGPGALNMYYGRKRRKTMPKVEDVACIAKVLGVSIDYLYNDDFLEVIPIKYKAICEALDGYTDQELKEVEIMIKTLNETRKKNK